MTSTEPNEPDVMPCGHMSRGSVESTPRTFQVPTRVQIGLAASVRARHPAKSKIDIKHRMEKEACSRCPARGEQRKRREARGAQRDEK